MANKEQLLGGLYAVSLLPEAFYDCGRDAVKWMAQKIIEGMIIVDESQDCWGDE